MKKYLPFFLFVLILYIGCSEKAPVMPDGEARMYIKAYWNSSTDSIAHYVPMPNAKVILNSEYGVMVKYTDADGVLDLSGIPSAVYNISVRMRHPMDENINLVATKLSISAFSGKTCVDTLYAKAVSSFGIAINEVYAAGPVNTQFYFYDQFVELYNSSDSVKYLDGMLLMRVSGNNDAGRKGPGADEDNDNDIDGISYPYKFPGNPGEKNYPIAPKQFVVIATKALDHRKFAAGSIDLSKADYEFYNQFSVEDMDNAGVPNLSNLRADNTSDFLISLTGDIIVLANGKDIEYKDGIDISTVIDGVEYQSSSNLAKTLDSRIDRGFVICPSKYSGKSIQRREPGVDTNDGNLDWEITNRPSPGYQ